MSFLTFAPDSYFWILAETGGQGRKITLARAIMFSALHQHFTF
jgi:hypothetical protein